MTIKTKSIEDRIADLERDVAALKAAVRSLPDAGSDPGFAEEGQPPVLGGNPTEAPSSRHSLEARVAKLEQEVARLRDVAGNNADVAAWRATMGCFKDDPEYEKAILAGAAWRRRAR